jgi:predicted GTPase
MRGKQQVNHEDAMTAKTYDSRCYDLAEVFLFDEPGMNSEQNRDWLARVIQQTIEDFIIDGRDRGEASFKKIYQPRKEHNGGDIW